MTTDRPTSPIGRRGLLRGGAATATATVAAIAANRPSVASAADADPLLLGRRNSASTTTVLDSGSGGATATFSLVNHDGPALHLEPLEPDWDGHLELGELANTTIGPLVGVSSDDVPQTTFLVTGLDLAALPRLVAIPPLRLLDTATRTGRARVLRTSPSPWDSANRLRAGAWADVAVDTAADAFTIESAFVNLTVSSGLGAGSASVYTPRTDPPNATLTFARGQSVSNSCLVGLDTVSTAFAVRVTVSATTHIALDLTGISVTDLPGPKAPATVARRARRYARRVAGLRRTPSIARR